MRKDFDFEEVGKKVPYQIPDAFFEEMQNTVFSRVQTEKRRKRPFLRLIPVTVAAAAVISAFVFMPYRNVSNKVISLNQNTVVVDDSWVEDLSDEDLQGFSDFSEYDVFMN